LRASVLGPLPPSKEEVFVAQPDLSSFIIVQRDVVHAVEELIEIVLAWKLSFPHNCAPIATRAADLQFLSNLQRDESNFPSAATFSVVKILEYFSNILDKEAGRRRWGKCEVGRRVKQSTL
jgi:hypothetical protein